jgi:hypothetical protein
MSEPDQTILVGDLAGGVLEDYAEQHFQTCHFLRIEVSHATDCVFEKCQFVGCKFTGADISGSQFILCTFDECVFHQTTVDSVDFLNCKIISPDFVNSSMLEVKFIDTQVSEGSMSGCDAKFTYFENSAISNLSLDDTDFSDADLSGALGLSDGQLTFTNGNSRTLLPEGVCGPDDWFLEDAEDETVAVSVGGVPGQQAAPLKVVWRSDRLVPDPRSVTTDERKSSSVIILFRALKVDVEAFVQHTSMNHPIGRHISLLSDLLRAGLMGINPVAVGYNVELIKAQLASAEGELTSPTIAAIRAVVAGGELLASQFSDWREVALNRDLTASDPSKLAEASRALQALAASMRLQVALFDRRIPEAIEIQANDIREAPANSVVQRGAAASSGNVLSALATRTLSGLRDETKVARDEVVKQSIDLFFKNNSLSIDTLTKWAPSVLGWLQHILGNL